MTISRSFFSLHVGAVHSIIDDVVGDVLAHLPAAGYCDNREKECEHGLTTPATGGGTTVLQAKTANEVLKAQEAWRKFAKVAHRRSTMQ